MPCRIPGYRCYKPKDLGPVVIGGTQHYLGKYGSPESVAEYNRLIQERLAQSTSLTVLSQAGKADLTVNELILSFLSGHAELHYATPTELRRARWLTSVSPRTGSGAGSQAGREPKSRSHAPYDRTSRPDVLTAAWRSALGNDGAPGRNLRDRE